MKPEDVNQINQIRELCLKHAEELLRGSLCLLQNKLDHISFHLSTLSLEEIGKIFLITRKPFILERQSDVEINLHIDDHERKIFWAIWGPSFGKDKITREQIEKQRGLAKSIHERRKEYLYVNPENPIEWHQKMKVDEAKEFYEFVHARYELEATKGGLRTDMTEEEIGTLKWFLNTTNDSEKRNLIFGNKSQEKLIELGNVQEWITWLKKTFDKNDEVMKQLLDKEFKKGQPPGPEAEKPKWKIKYKLITPSHSIRTKPLNDFNNRSSFVKLYKGADNHTLIVEITLNKNLQVQFLWHSGWTVCRHFAAALNVGTNGFFWWNIPIDTAKFYEEIRDFENNMSIVVETNPKLQLNWKSLRWKLDENGLNHSSLIFNYFSQILNTNKIEPVNDYIIGLGMLAKTDIHLRLEVNSFDQFFKALRKALVLNDGFNPDKEEIKEAGFRQIGHALPDRNEFDKLMDWGVELQQNKTTFSKSISLTEAIGMKHYCDLYFIVLAARELYNVSEERLVTDTHESNQSLMNQRRVKFKANNI